MLTHEHRFASALIYSVAFRVECGQLQLGFGLTAVAMRVHGNAAADTRALQRSASAGYQLGHCRMAADNTSWPARSIFLVIRSDF